jgi:hypothetical protein
MTGLWQIPRRTRWPSLVFNQSANVSDQLQRRPSMNAIYHWAGLAVGFLFIGLGFVGFWRGLSLRPTEPESRSTGRDTLWWWSWPENR